MGLIGDFDELKKVWKRASWQVKILLLLSGFLATSSIASISEAVVKWKGFILTGIAFYQDNFRNPVASLIRDWTPIHISPAYVDGITIAVLMIVAFFRGLILDLKVDRSRSNRIFTFSLIAICIGAFSFLLYKAITAPPNAHPSMFFIIFGYIGIAAIMLVPPRRAWDLSVLVYLVVPPLLVCIAAAVNLGLK